MAISLRNIDAVQHQALMRLTLRVMGETHRVFGEFQAWLTDSVLRTVDDAGNANGVGLMQTMPQIGEQWRQAVQEWVRLLEAAREQAASLPFGALVVKHNAFVGDGIRLEETMSADDVGAIIQMWQQRRQLALQATQARIYGDGLNLSQRIWRLENGGLSQIRNTLATAMAERTSAVQLARLVEAQLGADQDMPRWTRDRLYGMTAVERRRSDVGLLRGTENRGKGISYNALRLARTELQHANHAVTTEIARHSPWVTGRFVVLSPAHPKIDICDSLAAGGPYPKDSNLLPAHPSCMCHWKEDLMPKGDFTNQVKGWLRGENAFLDDYRGWLNARQITEPMPWNMSLADSLELWLGINQGAQAAALRLN